MEYVQFQEELKGKRRGLADLVRFVSTRTDQNPNYTLLLGAGCSVASGVRSASALSSVWRKELYSSLAGSDAKLDASVEEMREFLKKMQGSWYDPSREYSSLFEKRYDLQRQRRMFVEQEVAGKMPSIGYAYLTALVRQNYFNTIFTTNFDDLVNEAFYGYSDQRPIVCAHDSSINSVTVASKRPKIIKLHGDYLFDDLRATTRETESLEQNMRGKFTEYAKEYGLIVVGYSGGDRSIMDVLSALLKSEDYLKGGVYWCIRRGAEVSEELRKLIWKDRVYFVEMEGFDELMAEMYSTLNSGEVLPAELMGAFRRPTDMPAKLLSANVDFPVTTDVLRKAKERLERRSKRAALVNLIVKPDGEEKPRPISDSNLSDDELYLLTEIEDLISSDRYRDAIERARANLRNDLRPGMRIRLLRKIAQALRMMDENHEALAVVDELIQLQPRRVNHLLLKASVLKNWQEKLTCLDEAIAIDPYSVEAVVEKVRLLQITAAEALGEKRVSLVGEMDALLDRGIQIDPSWRNECWRQKFDLIDLRLLEEKGRRKLQEEIVSRLSSQNPLSGPVLVMRAEALGDSPPQEEVESVLNDVKRAKDRGGVESPTFLDSIGLAVIAKLKDQQRTRAEVESLLALRDSLTDEALVLKLAQTLRTEFGQDAEAIKLLMEALERGFDRDLLGELVATHCDLGQAELARAALKRWGRYLGARSLLQFNVRVHDSAGQYLESMREMDVYERSTGISQAEHRLYLLLKLQKWADAEQIARSLLEPVHFTPDATTWIVNYEIARKNQQKKVNVERLEGVLKYSGSNETHAAVSALGDKKAEAVSYVKKAMAMDKTFRFRAMDWPVFESIRKEQSFVDAISI